MIFTKSGPKKKKKEILDISIVGTSSFSLARLTTVFALVFHFFFLLPYISLFPLLNRYTFPLQITFGN